MRIIFVLVLLSAAAAHACPMCRDSVVTASNASGTIAASANFNGSVGWMLGGLFVVLTLLGRRLVRVIREVEISRE